MEIKLKDLKVENGLIELKLNSKKTKEMCMNHCNNSKLVMKICWQSLYPTKIFGKSLTNVCLRYRYCEGIEVDSAHSAKATRRY